VTTSPKFQLAQQDAVAFLRTLPAESVDVLVTDPAYESLEKHRAVGTTTRLKVSAGSSNPWFTVFPNARFAELFAEVFRVLKRDTHFYLMCDPETAFIAKPVGEQAGFKFWKPLVWDKRSIGMGYHYRARYEFVGIADVLEVPRIRGGYPAEKPSALSEILIRQSSVEGDLVVDPFMGSGSSGVAALSLGRRYAGNDVSSDSLKLARERLLAAGGTEAPIFATSAASEPVQQRLALG